MVERHLDARRPAASRSTLTDDAGDGHRRSRPGRTWVELARVDTVTPLADLPAGHTVSRHPIPQWAACRADAVRWWP